MAKPKWQLVAKFDDLNQWLNLIAKPNDLN